MLKVGSVTVLYNPSEDVISNIASYSHDCDISVVVDNSDIKNEICSLLQSNPNIQYIDLHGNQGIAKALNVGIKYLESQGCDIALTMDQDSVFPQEYFGNIKRIVENNISDYSIIGLNLNKPVDISDESIVNVTMIVTSGNFLKISDFLKVGGFNEDLFIDYVDFDIDHRLIIEGGQIGYLKGYSLKHTVGNPIRMRILGRNLTSMNHSPIRYYYRYRNLFYLAKMDWRFFKATFYGEIFKNIPKMILMEKQKKTKLKMIIRGISDARKGKLGKYSQII